MKTKYKFQDLRNTGFFEGEEYTFNSIGEVFKFLIDDFLNFRIDEVGVKIEYLSLEFMLNYLSLRLIEYQELEDLDTDDEISNKYIENYLEVIEKASTKEEKKFLLNQIYEEGFQDGKEDNEA